MHLETIGSPAMMEMLYAEKKRACRLDEIRAKHTDYDEMKAAYDKFLVKGIALQRRRAITSAMNTCYAAYMLSMSKVTQPNSQSDTEKVETDTV